MEAPLSAENLALLTNLAALPMPKGTNHYQAALELLRWAAPDQGAVDLAVLDAGLPMWGGPPIKSQWEAEPTGEILRRRKWVLKVVLRVVETPAEALGLYGDGFLVLFLIDEVDGRIALAGTDIEYRPADDSELISPEKFPLKRAGWPTEWA